MLLKILVEGDLIAICRQKTQHPRQNSRCSGPYINSRTYRLRNRIVCVHPNAVMCYIDVSFRARTRSSENPLIYSGETYVICSLIITQPTKH